MDIWTRAVSSRITLSQTNSLEALDKVSCDTYPFLDEAQDLIDRVLRYGAASVDDAMSITAPDLHERVDAWEFVLLRGHG